MNYDANVSEEDKDDTLTRQVIVDVLVPKFIGSIKINGNSYESEAFGDYYKYSSEEIPASISATNTLNIELYSEYGENNDEINPIIRIRENTKNDGPMDENKGNVENISPVKVSAKEKYSVYLQNHDNNLPLNKVDDEITKMPLGIVLYLPNDSDKGIKGIQVPKNINITITATSNTFTGFAPIINEYELKSSNDFSNYAPETLSNDVEVTEFINNSNNYTFTINFSNLKIGTSDFKISDEEKVKYIASNILVMQNEKEIDEITDDVIYNITASSNNQQLATTTINDNYVPFIGSYKSKITFTNNLPTDINNVSSDKHGESIFNLEEEFYINNEISYESGDSINSFTNYIKIDSRAIILSTISDDKPYIINESIKTNEDDETNLEEEDEEMLDDEEQPTLLFGVGEWSSEYFEINEQEAAVYCPESIDELTTEDFINLYGGPCLKLKDIYEEDSNIFWFDDLDAAKSAITENKNIIVVKYETNPDIMDVSAGSKVNITLKAAIKDDNDNKSIIGETFMVTSRGTSFDNSDDDPSLIYYLSEKERSSASEFEEDLTYNKTTYEKDENGENEIIEEETSTIKVDNETDQEILTSNVGDTLLVSAFKSYISEIKLKDSDNSTRTTFYSGLNDPIKFEIIPSVSTNANYSINDANIIVHLPKTLELYKMTGDKLPDSEEEFSDYIEYKYTFTSDDLKDGTLPSLVIHAFISLSTKDNTSSNIIAKINTTAKNGENIVNDVMTATQRLYEESFVLRNVNPVNNIGKVNNSNIDENDSYEYNVRAANSTSEAEKLSLLYVLPSSGDSVGSGSKFNGELIASLSNLPSGYSAYYTSDDYKTILTKELNSSTSVQWTTWTDPTNKVSNITAIKIEADHDIPSGEYFAGANGIDIIIETKDNKESDKYFNNFYMLYKKQEKVNAYVSNVSSVSVYDRIISGYAFDDKDYDGLYDSKNDERLKDMVVDLYRLKSDEITTDDEHINEKDTLTNEKGYYKFEGLKKGKYYVKYTFDCDKYTVTDKNKKGSSDTTSQDSDAKIINNVKINGKSVCYAISDILVLDNEKLEYNHIDIGLKVRQEFDIKIDKYITNAKIYKENELIYNKDYSNAKMVKLDVKDLDDTLFRITYVIEIQNTKYFPGTVGILMENIPEEMEFDSELPENEGWEEEYGYLTYPDLEKTILMPGEKIYLKVVLDLEPYSAGDFINYVAADNLNISNANNSFLELSPKNEVEINDDDYSLE